MPDFVPISYSRIDTFKQCPKKFYELSIAKTVPYVQGEAAKQGDVIHKLLEKRVESGAALPPGYEYLEPIAAAIIKAPGQTFTELALTFDRNLVGCGAKDWNRAWIRIRVDVAKILEGTSWAGDYKSGQKKYGEDALQMKICAAGMFQAFPDLETVATSYIWTRENHVEEPTVYTRADAAQIWQEVFEYSRQIEEAKRTNHWPAQRNKFCAWCDVNRAGRCPEAGVRPR